MDKKKALTIAGIVGVGVGLAVAGTMLWRKYRKFQPECCFACDSTGDCEVCEGNGYYVEDKRSNSKGRKARS